MSSSMRENNIHMCYSLSLNVTKHTVAYMYQAVACTTKIVNKSGFRVWYLSLFLHYQQIHQLIYQYKNYKLFFSYNFPIRVNRVPLSSSISSSINIFTLLGNCFLNSSIFLTQLLCPSISNILLD